MEKFNSLIDWYRYVVDYLTEKKVTFFVHGSTLLGQVRDNRLLERITYDKELNFGMKAEDITQQFLWDLKKDFPYFSGNGDIRDNSLLYFGPEPIIKYHSMNKSQWDMEPGIALIATFWRGKTKWIEYMGGDLCLTWPLYQLETLSCINIGNRTVSCPIDRHAWLSHYFGDDYMTEKRNWHWSVDSGNLESYKELVKEGEI